MLLLDFGNSAIKGQWWCKGELQYSFCCQLDGRWQPRLKSILSDIKATQCYYASVADSASEKPLLNCLNDAFGVDDHVRLQAQEYAAGVQNGYLEPEKLGVDRWLALLGAAEFASVDKLIVDAGSAITIDLLSKDGKHLGGAIMPGFNTSVERFKQMMRQVNFDHPDILHIDQPGRSTEACIHINCESESTDQSMVDNLIGRWWCRLASDAILIVTGGDAVQIQSHGIHARYEVPDLVFRGMINQLKNLE